ncbi:hypothetical protein N44_03521 [Microcystis aeruginosa NIES-44]|uniref:Uncharacterized protein n=1 Tax=Microcystis aeruginosa NIES-44 TaxID=449439 RepID=A0A0A1VVY9_MICAE|nr:hypothetical protein N44_03521 [Microcystis aeruginosa NIES-44]
MRSQMLVTIIENWYNLIFHSGSHITLPNCGLKADTKA